MIVEKVNERLAVVAFDGCTPFFLALDVTTALEECDKLGLGIKTSCVYLRRVVRAV